MEDRDGTTFVGLDTGWNVINEHFVYRIPFHPILCRAADAEPVAQRHGGRSHQRGQRSLRRGPSDARGRGRRHRRDPERRLVQRVDDVGPLLAPRAVVGLLHRSGMNDLPVAERWFRSQHVTEDDRSCSSRITSTRSSSRTCGTCAGRDRDLVVDTGNGIGDLRGELAPLVERSTGRGRRHARSLRPHRRDCTRSTSVGATRRCRRDPRTGRARVAARGLPARVSRTRSVGTATSRPSV